MVLLLASILFPLGFGTAIMCVNKTHADMLALIGGCASFALNVAAALVSRGSVYAYFGGVFEILQVLDDAARVMYVLAATVFLLAIVFLSADREHRRRRAGLYGFLFLTLGALNQLYAAGNLFTFYLCFELVSLLSFPLILHGGSKRARRAALIYIGFSFTGTALALTGMKIAGEGALVPFAAGGLGLEGKDSLTAYLLFALGFGCKAGLYPLSAWLVPAANESPVAVSALFAGVIAAAGVFGAFRVSFGVFGAQLVAGSWVQSVLIVLAGLTALMGAMLALREQILKKRLAYLTVSQVSFALIGFFTFTKAGFVGGMAQIVCHTCAKTGLFFGAGAIQRETGFTRVDEMRGLGRDMPNTMILIMLLSFSVIGIPPFGGFGALWQIGRGALEFGGTAGAFALIALVLSALLSAGTLLPMALDAFFPGKDFIACVSAPPKICWRVFAPLCVLCAAVLVIGLFFGILGNMAEGVYSSLIGGWTV
jgi:multicomponent Na+:H+ antiporter subunit D